MRNPSLVLAGALVTLWCGRATPALAAVDASLLSKIDEAARSTKTLSAEFTQTNRMKLFRQALASSGRLWFRAPRQIRWQYLSPDPSLLILDGRKATMSSPGAAPQVFDLEKDPTMRVIFDQLLTFVGGGSLAQLEGDYTLSASDDKRNLGLVLVPKPGSVVEKAFARIELTFDGKTQVKKIVLVEKNGDEKRIDFTKVERNRELPAETFR